MELRFTHNDRERIQKALARFEPQVAAWRPPGQGLRGLGRLERGSDRASHYHLEGQLKLAILCEALIPFIREAGFNFDFSADNPEGLYDERQNVFRPSFLRSILRWSRE